MRIRLEDVERIVYPQTRCERWATRVIQIVAWAALVFVVLCLLPAGCITIKGDLVLVKYGEPQETAVLEIEDDG